MAYDQPNYTQIPNALIEAIPGMKEAELKVTLAIARVTLGYHRDMHGITISQLETATGMSRPSVTAGIKAGEARGTIEKNEDCKPFEYGLVVKNFSTTPGGDGKNFLPNTPENGKNFLPSTSYKESNKESTTFSADADDNKNLSDEEILPTGPPTDVEEKTEDEPPAPSAVGTTTPGARERDMLFEGLLWVCYGMRYQNCKDSLGRDGKMVGQLNRECRLIRKAGFDHINLQEWWTTRWFPRWKWTMKNGGEIKRPRPSEVRQLLPQIREEATVTDTSRQDHPAHSQKPERSAPALGPAVGLDSITLDF